MEIWIYQFTKISFNKTLVVMYYTPGHLCSGGVVHHYSYQSAQFDENHTLVQFDENYTLVQFVETIIWFNLMKLYMFSN